MVKHEEIIGKAVVNMKAEKLGEVKDVAYHASGKKALIISTPQGVDKIYPFDLTVAINDVILLDENKNSTQLRSQVPPSYSVPSGPVPTLANRPPLVPQFVTPTTNAPAIMTKTCPSCNRQNRLQSKFCVQCGKPL